jgi:hypothetical protein
LTAEYEDEGTVWYITGDRVNLRRYASFTNMFRGWGLMTGEEVLFIRREGDWVLIERRNGTRGYVYTNYVSPVNPLAVTYE